MTSKILMSLCLLLIAFAISFGQGRAVIPLVTTVPAKCTPSGNNSPVMVWKKSGINPGLYECTATDSWTYRTNISTSGIVAKSFAYWNAGSALTATIAPTNGQLLIGDTGNVPALGTLTGTANQVTVTNGAHSITLSLPQSIHTGATPQFAGATFSAAITPTAAGGNALGSAALPWSSLIIGGASPLTLSASPTASRTVTVDDTTMTLAEGLLSRTASVDMNTATATTLYTCPAGKTCLITKVVVRNASTSLTTASFSFGWNSTSFNDVSGNGTHAELTGATLYTVLLAKNGAALGTAAGTFKVLMNTLQGGAATTTMEVFGYTF